jgi:hypothetical protein
MQPLPEPLTASVTTDPELIDGNFLMLTNYVPLEREIFGAQQRGSIGIIVASDLLGK